MINDHARIPDDRKCLHYPIRNRVKLPLIPVGHNWCTYWLLCDVVLLVLGGNDTGCRSMFRRSLQFTRTFTRQNTGRNQPTANPRYPTHYPTHFPRGKLAPQNHNSNRPETNRTKAWIQFALSEPVFRVSLRRTNFPLKALPITRYTRKNDCYIVNAPPVSLRCDMLECSYALFSPFLGN